jgi:acyl-CoA thioesterase
VVRVDDGRFEARVDRGWWVVGGPNGGYLAAIILRALTEVVGVPERAPRSLTVHYTSPPHEGAILVSTAIEHVGRSVTSCSARVYQEDRLVATAMAAFSVVRSGPEFCDLTPPDAPGPEKLPRTPTFPDSPPIIDRWDMRWTMGRPPTPDAPPEREAVAGGWIRLEEPQVIDAPAVAAIMDAWIPPVFSRAREPLRLPTVDLTVHFRTSLPLPGAEADDFLLAVFRTNAAAEGFIEEDGEVWSANGRLVAQSRQLAVVIPLA